jgi:hypothetical protein
MHWQYMQFEFTDQNNLLGAPVQYDANYFYKYFKLCIILPNQVKLKHILNLYNFTRKLINWSLDLKQLNYFMMIKIVLI